MLLHGVFEPSESTPEFLTLSSRGSITLTLYELFFSKGVRALDRLADA